MIRIRTTPEGLQDALQRALDEGATAEDPAIIVVSPPFTEVPYNLPDSVRIIAPSVADLGGDP